MELTKNTGFLAAPPRETDYIAGENSPLKQEVYNHFADWTVFLPRNERQSGVYFDSMACVTFSALNSLESQIRGHLAYQRIPREMIKELKELGYFNEHLEFNLSDRFTAKMSGTTRAGNYFVNVWDSIRKHGVIPEADWTWDPDQRNPVFDWDDYYAEIPQDLKDKGLEFLAILKKYGFEIKYEWVSTHIADIAQNLYQAPIQIATPTCSGWSTKTPVQTCGMKANHATMAYRISNTAIYDFDTYKPFQKQLAIDYKIDYAIKGLLLKV